MLRTEMLCGLASWREKFMDQVRVADVSRKGCQPRKLSGQEAQRRFPGLASGDFVMKGLFFGVLSHFAQNQAKFLSINNLHPASGHLQSRSIKPNQA
jgi:hypothetical protein